ncbi:MAG: MFS transporter, partial [Parahaliea sp.]
LLARLPAMRQAGRWLFAALLVFSLSILVFALSGQLWLSLAALFVYGASDMVSVNIRLTLIQLATPDTLRGRVSAVNSLFIATSNDLGDFRAGAVAAAIGTVPAVLAGAAMAFVITLGGLASCRKLRALDRLEDAQCAQVKAPPGR